MKTKTRQKSASSSNGELLEMHQAIEMLKTTRQTFYRWVRTGKIKGMKVGRQWRFYRADIDRFIKGQEPRIDLLADIMPLITTLETQLKKLDGEKALPHDENKLERVVKLICLLAFHMRVSDIHMEPCEKNVATLRYRIDGGLNPIAEIDLRLLSPLIAQWKTMASLNVHEKALPQVGRVRIETAEAKRSIDLLISILPTILGESLSARLVDRNAISGTVNDMGYSARNKEIVQRHLKERGLIVVTGLTGSGKSRTLYMFLNEVMQAAGSSRRICTVEDPVTFMLPGTTQTAVNAKAGLTMGNALRAVMRSDPDVVMMGEVRDSEMLQFVHEIANAGHLVLTTMHTDDAAGVLQRMLDIGVPPFKIAESVKLIAAQRLIRRLCVKCKVEREPAGHVLEQIRQHAESSGVDWESLPKKFHEPVGCAACNQKGFAGRAAITEVLEMTPAIRAALVPGALAQDLKAIAIREGMTTIFGNAIEKAAEGITSLAEVVAAVPI